jgi:hypothetical protein
MVSGGQSKWWSTPVGESGQIVEQMGDAMAADMCKQVWDDKQAINLSQIYDDDEIFELEPTEGGGPRVTEKRVRNVLLQALCRA